MIDIKFDPEIKTLWPDYRVIAVECTVENLPTPDSLWQELTAFADSFRQLHEMADINRRPAIAATRQAYKRFGKEPNRYRPSAEALCRRMVKGMELYRTLSVIDLINLLSVMTGYSIGGFDADKVDGDSICLGKGREDEPYEAIGRGSLNIAGLPIWRDSTGGIGTPTSDNERTKLTPDTRRLLMTVNIFGSEMSDEETIALTRRLLESYAAATDISFRIIHV
ncbi:MAG: hypothetical protein K2F74_07785 [Muribaculaceae bacterium]|nr:hypothetical protein [Muribaculaceae bacterium]MDE6131478.1 hypothetical protein [Muribaculaceae bacterium]